MNVWVYNIARSEEHSAWKYRQKIKWEGTLRRSLSHGLSLWLFCLYCLSADEMLTPYKDGYHLGEGNKWWRSWQTKRHRITNQHISCNYKYLIINDALVHCSGDSLDPSLSHSLWRDADRHHNQALLTLKVPYDVDLSDSLFWGTINTMHCWPKSMW